MADPTPEAAVAPVVDVAALLQDSGPENPVDKAVLALVASKALALGVAKPMPERAA